MKRHEKYVYDLLKKSPPLKNAVVFSYQLMFSIFSKKEFYSSYKFTSLDDQFFGFHDKTPINSDNSIILGFKPSRNFKRISLSAKGQVLLNHSKNWSKQEIVSETIAWNNVMGPMLHWYDDEHICFNSVNSNKITGVLLNINSGKKTHLDHPLVHSNKSTKLFVGYNLRSAELGMKGYGIPKEIFHLDNSAEITISKNTKPIFSLNQHDLQDLTGTKNRLWVHHCLFSNDGEWMYFMVRHYNKLGFRISQLFLYESKSNRIIDTKIKGMISHLNWADNKTIIVYMNPGLNKEDSFYFINVDSLKYELLNKAYISDGHPTTLNKNTFISDSYPDRNRHQYLYTFSLSNQNKKIIAKNHIPLKARGAFQYDLHPRLSKDKTLISIDCFNKNKLSQKILEVESLHLPN